MGKLETWVTSCKSKLRRISCELELSVCLVRYFQLFRRKTILQTEEAKSERESEENQTKENIIEPPAPEKQKRAKEGKSKAPGKQPIGNALIFLQEKVKPLTDDSKVLFLCSKMIIRKPSQEELEHQMSEMLVKITNTFYKVFFVVEGYNRSFILENVLLVGVTSSA